MHLLLAEDDDDDCLLFKDALRDLYQQATLTIVNNGEHLMTLLRNLKPLPQALFLDLNMPRKNGIECLSEIQQLEYLKDLPVVICSTASEPETIIKLYDLGACYYFQKPANFAHLKMIINKSLQQVLNSTSYPRDRASFIIQAQPES